MDENHRRSVKKAQKQGLSVKTVSSPADCSGLFKATKEKPEVWSSLLTDYDRALAEHKLAQTFGVYDQGGQLVAGLYLVWDRFRSYYLLGGFRRDSDESSQVAMSLGLWEAMRYSKE